MKDYISPLLKDLWFEKLGNVFQSNVSKKSKEKTRERWEIQIIVKIEKRMKRMKIYMVIIIN